MRMSTKGRYGLRAMIELAQKYGNRPVLMKTIAENQDISRKYLHALLTSLKSAGLIKSVRGSSGGYILARMPSRIRLDEILKVTEGPMSLIDCVEDENSCERSDKCVARDIWLDVSNMIEKRLASITLEEMVNRKAEKENGSLMYYI